MKKEKKKKISISYFHNLSIKPKSIKKEKDCYPVYCQLNFNGKNTKFSPSLSFGIISKKQFDSLFIQKVDKTFNKEILEFEKRLREIIKFEFQKLGTRFRLAGISNRLIFYNKEIDKTILEYCKSQIDKWAQSNFSYLSYVNEFIKQPTSNSFEEFYLKIHSLQNSTPELPLIIKNGYIAWKKICDFNLNIAKTNNFDWLVLNLRRDFSQYLNHEKSSYTILGELIYSPSDNLNYLNAIDNILMEILLDKSKK